MAHHKSAKKRMRQYAKRRLENRYYAKTARNAIQQLKETTDKEDALKIYPKVASKIDKLSRRNQIHKNKAANIKSKLMRYINNLEEKTAADK